MRIFYCERCDRRIAQDELVAQSLRSTEKAAYCKACISLIEKKALPLKAISPKRKRRRKISSRLARIIR